VLFVIGACALIAPEPLQLTWFPLARDSCFYAVDLLVVTVVFLDEMVYWYEALVLFMLYIVYITFMKFSERIEAWVKCTLLCGAGSEEGCWASPLEKKQEMVQTIGSGELCVGNEVAEGRKNLQRASTLGTGTSSEGKKGNFKHRSVTLQGRQFHTNVTAISQVSPQPSVASGTGLHPDTDERVGRSDTGGTGAQSKNCSPPRTSSRSMSAPAQSSATTSVATPHGAEPASLDMPNVPGTFLAIVPNMYGNNPASVENPGSASIDTCEIVSGKSKSGLSDKRPDIEESQEEHAADEDDEENAPLSLSPPTADAGAKDWAWYLLTLPIVFCLVCTVPDVRREGYRNYFVVTFIISILWIAAFTWAMVWFAMVIAETAGLDDHIMGLTVLAAGTSVPDLMTSILVARQGHGDMAISSSIGSNIFDVTVGLPIPWLLFSAIRNGKAVTIKNEGLEISVALLLMMLAFTIGTIVFHSWVMTKWMGGWLLMLYLLFEIVSVCLTFAPEGSLKLIRI